MSTSASPEAAGVGDQGSMHRPWLHRYAMLLVLCVVLLIGIGGTVTSTGAGMAVPDWPTTFDHNMFTAPPSVWFHEADRFWEHFHRLMGSFVGLLCIGLAVWLTFVHAARPWRVTLLWAALLCAVAFGAIAGQVLVIAAGALAVAPGLWLIFGRASRAWLVALGWGMLLLVIVQGLMGGFRVTEGSDLLAAVHGIVGQLVLAGCVLIAAATSRKWGEALRARAARGGEPGGRGLCGLRLVALGLLMALVVQLALGAWMRHHGAGLAIPDFPLAYGQVLPPLHAAGLESTMAEWDAAHPGQIRRPYTTAQVAVHFTHRAWAIVVCAIAVTLVAWLIVLAPGNRLTSWPARGLVVMLAIQVMLGAYVVWSRRQVDLATAHQLGGALVLAVATLLTIRLHLLGYAGVGGAMPDTGRSSAVSTAEAPAKQHAAISEA